MHAGDYLDRAVAFHPILNFQKNILTPDKLSVMGRSAG